MPDGSARTVSLGEAVAESLIALRRAAPRVHALTSPVALVLTANALLALGAVPSLTATVEEAGAFAATADAVLVNLGMLDAERRAAIPVALAAARGAGRPWVLDPVFVERSPARLALARALLGEAPALVRCNEAEAALLFGALDPRAMPPAVWMSGPLDRLSDGERQVTLDVGHPVMGRVTALGCAAGALAAAFLAVEADALTAGATAALAMGLAGEQAAARAAGPGSFVPAFLDALAALTPERLAARLEASA